MGGGSLAIMLTLPAVIGNADEFNRVSRRAASAGTTRPYWDTWWYWITNPLPQWMSQATNPLPQWMSQAIHPAIVVLSAPIALLVWRRRCERSDALALCAFLFLVRCVFDPVNTEYYHLPLLLALLSWETLSQRPLPYATLLTATAMFVTFRYLAPMAGVKTASIFYLLWTVGLAIYLLGALHVRDDQVSDVLRPVSITRTSGGV